MPKEISPSTSQLTLRLPINTKRAYYTVGLFVKSLSYNFLTKYAHVYEAAEFESSDGKFTYTLSCAVNDKILNEIESITKLVKDEPTLDNYTFRSPIKERSFNDEAIAFINIKLRRNAKDEAWMFTGTLPDADDDCLLKIQPRVYVTSDTNEVGIYFELKAVEK